MIRRTYLTMALASSLALATTSSCIIAVGNDRSVMTPKASPEAMSPTLGGKLYTSAWIQRSAEYKALCHQAYNIATERLLAATARGGHRWAIVTDIDETIVDNSANSVHQALKGEDFTQASWDKWRAPSTSSARQTPSGCRSSTSPTVMRPTARARYATSAASGYHRPMTST